MKLMFSIGVFFFRVCHSEIGCRICRASSNYIDVKSMRNIHFMVHFKIDSVCEGISFRPERVRIADKDGESYWESIGVRSNREEEDVGGGRGRGNDDDDDEDDDFSEEEMEAVMRKVFHYPEHWGVKGVRRIDEDRYLPSSWHDLVEEMHRVLID